MKNIEERTWKTYALHWNTLLISLLGNTAHSYLVPIPARPTINRILKVMSANVSANQPKQITCFCSGGSIPYPRLKEEMNLLARQFAQRTRLKSLN
jgi:hypothetical protein